MKINDSIKDTIYHNMPKTKDKIVEDSEKQNLVKESFDVSILHQNRANTYNTVQAQSILKNVNYDNEVASFSKQNLEGFSQPLTQAQAHLSSQAVNQLLQ